MNWLRFVPFTPARREYKARKYVLAAARAYWLSWEDMRPMPELKAALDAGDAEACSRLLTELDPPKSFALGREWLDILVVSISVAMAFRAYFYEPFNIPTGSMQPTLYGNHSESCSPAQADLFDTTPLRWVKWALTGRMYRCYVAPFSGTLVLRPTNDGRIDMRVMSAGQVSAAMPIPTDVIRGIGGDAPEVARRACLPCGVGAGERVRAGQLLWSGYDITGDFLFVNRWLWNVRHPARGDVMIFSTTGIKGLQQGTHYIKRMTALPNETIEIVKPDVYINGVKIAPLKAMIGKNGEHTPEPEPAQMSGPVTLGPAHYFACGDNSANSYDSRYWGPVPARNLCGIAGGVFWPLFGNRRWGNIK